MNSIKKRNSSLELLRIICMVAIIFHHYAIHTIFNFNTNIITLNELFIKFIASGGKLACDIFILIMGYFMISSKTNYKKLLKLILKMTVYGIIISVVLFGFKLIKFSLFSLIKELLPILFGGWFIIWYIVLYLLSPFFNKFLTKLDKKDYKRLLILLISIWSIVPTFSLNAWIFSKFDNFLIMYMLGAYIKLYDIKLNKKKNIIGIISGIVVFLSPVAIILFGRLLNLSILYTHSLYFTDINSIFVVIFSVYVFIMFKNITFYNKTINNIASGTLGIYLIHDDRLLRNYLWNSLYSGSTLIYSKYLIFHCFVKVLSVFFICLIIDKILEYMLNISIYKIIDRIE